MNAREKEGMVLAATRKINRKGDKWLVPSRDAHTRYEVRFDSDKPTCNCHDHELTGKPCKHIFAAQIVKQRELFDTAEEPVLPPEAMVPARKPTYKQNWSAYNAAQNGEKAIFQALLRDLCSDLPDRPKTNGRQWLPMSDMVFSAVFKVYCGMSARRFMTDLKDAHKKGYISKLPCHNSVLGVFESPDTFEILKSLVVQSAAPLKSIETNFACDSTGFSGCRFDRWFDEKWGKPIRKEQRAWIKCHAMVGVKTNVVTAVEIHGQYTNDCTQLPDLLATTAKRFKINEVSGDLAYSSHDNLLTVERYGGSPMIPFKCNATAGQGGLWAKMFHYFQLNRDEFLGRYHRRSNVESTFSAIKRKFGDSVRAKSDAAMRNEVLAKLVAHNVCVVIQEMHESGIEPTFFDKPAAVDCA